MTTENTKIDNWTFNKILKNKIDEDLCTLQYKRKLDVLAKLREMFNEKHDNQFIESTYVDLITHVCKVDGTPKKKYIELWNGLKEQFNKDVNQDVNDYLQALNDDINKNIDVLNVTIPINKNRYVMFYVGRDMYDKALSKLVSRVNLYYTLNNKENCVYSDNTTYIDVSTLDREARNLIPKMSDVINEFNRFKKIKQAYEKDLDQCPYKYILTSAGC